MLGCDAIDTDMGDMWSWVVYEEVTSELPSKGARTMITFLAWWTSAAIIAGSGAAAWFAHLNYRVH